MQVQSAWAQKPSVGGGRRNKEGCAPRFQLFIARRGLVPVTDPMRMGVMDLLSRSDMTLAELARALGAPLSTLFANLGRMVADGLIATYAVESDKRKVMYASDSYLIMESVPADPEAKRAYLDVLKDSGRGQPAFYKAIVTYAAFSLSRAGVGVCRMLDFEGRMLAEAMRPALERGKVEDLIPVVRGYAAAAGLPEMSVFTFIPLTIVLQLGYHATERSAAHFAVAVGLIVSALTINTGAKYRVTSESIFGAGRSKLKFVAEPDSGCRDAAADMFRGGMPDPRDFRPPGEFAVYVTRSGPRYVSSGLRLRILASLLEREQTLTELSKALGASQSTMFANLGRMAEEGLISAVDDPSDPRRMAYRPECFMLLCSKEPSASGWPEAMGAVREAAEGPEGLYRSVFKATMHILDTVGIDMRGAAAVVGMAIGRGIAEKGAGKRIEDVMDRLSRSPGAVGAESLAVETYIPLTLTVECQLGRGEAMSAVVRTFYGGLFSALLTYMTGTGYAATRAEALDGASQRYVLEAVRSGGIPPLVREYLGGGPRDGARGPARGPH